MTIQKKNIRIINIKNYAYRELLEPHILNVLWDRVQLLYGSYIQDCIMKVRLLVAFNDSKKLKVKVIKVIKTKLIKVNVLKVMKVIKVMEVS